MAKFRVFCTIKYDVLLNRLLNSVRWYTCSGFEIYRAVRIDLNLLHPLSRILTRPI